MNTQEQHLITQLKQGLRQSNHEHVIAQCLQQLTNTLSEDAKRDVLYVLAVAYRMSSNIDDALSTLNQLETLYPDYGRGFQELGYCYLRINAQDKAAHAFYQATRFNPALLSAWQQLAAIYQRDNQAHALLLASQHIEFLSSLPKPLLGAHDLMHEGQLHKAEQLCRQFLAQHKHHPEAMMLLAELGIQLKVYHDAEFLLESCVALYPDNDKAQAAYQSLLAKLGKFPQAVKVARERLNKQPNSFNVKVSLAHALVGVGDLDSAIDIYHGLLDVNEDRPALWIALGHALKAKGNVESAISAYKKAAFYANDFGDAYWSLANTKTYRFDNSELDEMQRQESASTTKLEDRIHLCFALGKGFEDAKCPEKSFHYYNKGNGLKKRTLRFDIARTEAALNAQQEACTAELLGKESGCKATDPIFIVGLPRAGSTLLEQILASHSLVDGTMELHDILGIASSLSNVRTKQNQLQQRAYLYNLHELTDEECERLGEQYLSQTQAYRQSAPYFIDKMPNNFIHIGLIKRILPNAKIIDARRDPMDCCFSGFKQLFGEGQEFSYSLDDIGRYYRAYEQLMDHWHKAMPGQILTVQHEDVLNDLEGQVRRILDYCGLPFESQCLSFYKTRRVIKTPSSEQVRQPIYRSGMQQWKPFEPYLDELKAALKI